MPERSEVLSAIDAALAEMADQAVAAARSAREAATAKENAAENKYDTLGLEAAYLAHGQSERAATLLADRQAFARLPSAAPDVCSVGSLVTLENAQGKLSYLLLGPAQGGLKITTGTDTVMVVTPDAPLGGLLLGREVGDEVMQGSDPLQLVGLA